MSKIVKEKYKIEGMHCSSCAMNIDFDLEDVEGILAANTNYAKQLTEIEYENDKVKKEDIIRSVEKTGYKAIPISSEN